MSNTNVNLQDSFLNQVRKDSVPVQLQMLDGSRIQGVVKGFDNFTVIVFADDDNQHMLYKHAIAQIIAPKSVRTAPPEARKRHEKADRPAAPRRKSSKAPRKPEDEKSPEKFNVMDFTGIQLGEGESAKPEGATKSDGGEGQPAEDRP